MVGGGGVERKADREKKRSRVTEIELKYSWQKLDSWQNVYVLWYWQKKSKYDLSLSLSLKLTEGPVEQQQRQQKRKDQNFYKTTRLHTLKEQEV